MKRYINGLLDSQGIVFIHPNWWGQPPAILTGWIDRVFRPGVAYAFTGDGRRRGSQGASHGDEGRGVQHLRYSPAEGKSFFRRSSEMIWKRCIFEFCGITDHFRRTFSVVVTSTPEMRRRWLDDAAGVIDSCFPAVFE